MEPIILRFKKCPVCQIFSTTSVEEFLVHVHKEHICKLCKYHHLNNNTKNKQFCKDRNFTYKCPVAGCRSEKTYTNFFKLVFHVDFRHKKCERCHKYTCVCFRDQPCCIQVGGGHLITSSEEEDDRREDDDQTEMEKTSKVLPPPVKDAAAIAAQEDQPLLPSPQQPKTITAQPSPRPCSSRQAVQQNVSSSPCQGGQLRGVDANHVSRQDKSHQVWRPWTSTPPQAANLAPVDEDERQAYLRIRDRLCPYCPLEFPDKETCQRHCVNAHPEACQEQQCEGDVEDPLDLYLERSAFDDTYRTYEVNLDNVEVQDINALFLAVKEKYKQIIQELLKKYRNFKVQFRIMSHFFRDDSGIVTHALVPMESFNFVVENENYANFAFRMALSNYNVRIEDFVQNGSGWRFLRLNEFSIFFSEYRPFVGSGGNIPLPLPLAKKRACLINVPSDDERCFVRCLIAALYGHEADYCKKRKVVATKKATLVREKQTIDSNRKAKLHRRKFYDDREGRIHRDLNLDRINLPFDVKQAGKFERQNPEYGLNIFVYDENPETPEPTIIPNQGNLVPDSQLEEEILNYNIENSTNQSAFQKQMETYKELRQHIYPLKIVKEEKKNIIDILLIQNGDEGHYVLIEDLLQLMKYPHREQRHICRYCLQTFNKMADTHQQYCAALGRMRTNFPEDPFLEWKSMWKTIPLLYLGAMDFESRLIPINITKGNTIKTKHHKASSYAWAIRDKDGNIKNSKEYVAFKDDEVVAEQMLLELLKEADDVAGQVGKWNDEANKLAPIVNKAAPRPLPNEKCGFCKKPLFSGKSKRYVRHHNHFPPFNFEFHAHAECNSSAVTSERLVCVAHNLRSYDSHFLIKACAKKSIDHHVEVIGTSCEKFFAVYVGNNLMFIDSLNFFNASLASVADTMDKKKDFPLSRKYFMKKFDNDESKVELMLSKGVYPYDHFQDMSNYDETELPPPEAFYDSLNNKPVDPADYEHAKTVWEKLEVKDLREYTKLYNMSDVLLLLDCFQKLRNVFLEQYELDPAHYFSLPHLSWDCALKSTKSRFEIITDETMVPWLQSGMRGGVASGLEYRAAKANNPFLPDHDPTKPNSYIMVHDINNLYGSALCTFLPTGSFEWIEEGELNRIKENPNEFIRNIGDEADRGYFFEVDLDFPTEIHDKLKGLTPAPYKRVTEYEEYSPGMQELAEKLGVADACMNTPRLLADLHPRRHYVVHYRVLKFYTTLGIKITKIHRGVSFHQSATLREYISGLAKLRKASTTDFEKNMWKLAANSVYGKSIEQVRSRSRFVIVTDRETALKYNRKPTVAQVILLDSDQPGEDIAIIRLKKLSVLLDKPTYVGISVLDEAKRILYDWFYNYAQPKWGENICTLATDTDSVISLIETENVYQDMYDDKDYFDMSDYDPVSNIWKKYHCPINKKKLGKMKDEQCNKTVSSFIFLRPKMYMYDVAKIDGQNEDGSNIFQETTVKKAKGLNRQCVKEKINREDYMEALENPVQKRVPCTSIRSDKYELYTIVLSKRGLSSFEQKRYVLPDNVSTLPFGHYLISHEDNLPSDLKPKRARLDTEENLVDVRNDFEEMQIDV